MKLQIGSTGVIAIIGKTNQAVTIQVTGLETSGSIAHLVNQFGKNCIETRCVESKKDLVFFEYNLRGELRNSDRLLKKLRGKLIKASHIVHSEFMQEMSNLDWQIDNAFHRAPYECK